MILSNEQQTRILETLRTTGSRRQAASRVGPKRRPAAYALIDAQANEEPPQEKQPYIGGRIEPDRPRPIDRSRRGVDTFLISAVQNNTRLHEPVWAAMLAFAEHYKGTILLGRILYDASVQSRLQKVERDTSKEIWFDPRVSPHLADCALQLAPSLVYRGDLNTIPSAASPLSGYEGIGEGASAIIPHTQVALESLGRLHGEAPITLMTSGAATASHYLQRKAGQLAEFRHNYGFLLVQILPDDSWWARHVQIDREGRACDLDLMFDGHSMVKGVPAQTLTCGDLHYARHSPSALENLFGKGGLVERVDPQYVVLHDALDFQSQSHHLKRQPAVRVRLHDEGRNSVSREIRELALFLDKISRQRSVVVVDSNHDRHLSRWLDEADWRDDPVNARDILRWNLLRLEQPDAHLFSTVIRAFARLPNVKFLRLGDSFRVDGVEHGLHGDLGRNGARGSPATFSKAAFKATVGHSHTPSIHRSTFTCGTTSRLRMEYNAGGLTSWCEAHTVLYQNGKRAIILPNARGYTA